MSDTQYIRELEAVIVVQSQQIKLLEEKVILLLGLLQKKGIKKDSHNSSLPPSSDISSKTKSLHPKSSLKSGGQFGHQGTTLEMSQTPDNIVTLPERFLQFLRSIFSRFTVHFAKQTASCRASSTSADIRRISSICLPMSAV